jgi:hypothetical protein
MTTGAEEVRLERAERTPGLEDWRVEEVASGCSRYGWFVLKGARVTPRRRRQARKGLALTKRRSEPSMVGRDRRNVLESHEWCLRETEQTRCRGSKPLKG